MTPDDPQLGLNSGAAAGSSTARTATRTGEDEALIEDIDEYVAETDPEHLSEAEAELQQWETPTDPTEVATLPPAGDWGNVVKVFSAYSEVEGNIVKGVLDAAGIPSAFDNLGGAVMGGIFSAGEQVWADVVVPEAYVDQARQVIADASTEGTQ